MYTLGKIEKDSLHCYLAGTITNITLYDAQWWRCLLSQTLKEQFEDKITFFDPTQGMESVFLPNEIIKLKKTNENHEKFGDYFQKDFDEIDKSDIVVFNIYPDKPNIGTLVELGYILYLARHHPVRKPLTIVVTEDEELQEHDFVVRTADKVFKRITEAEDYLKLVLSH